MNSKTRGWVTIKKWYQEPKCRWKTITHTLPRFDDAKQVFSPSLDAPNHEEQAWLHLGSLSRKVFELWGFWFALCSVLGLKGVFVTVETEVGYGGWRKHTSGGLSNTFQTTGRQSDFRSNHRRVICNYPFFLLYNVLNSLYILLHAVGRIMSWWIFFVDDSFLCL